MKEIFKILNRFRTRHAFAVGGGALDLILHFKVATTLLTHRGWVKIRISSFDLTRTAWLLSPIPSNPF